MRKLHCFTLIYKTGNIFECQKCLWTIKFRYSCTGAKFCLEKDTSVHMFKSNFINSAMFKRCFERLYSDLDTELGLK